MKRQCDGQRESISSLSVRIPTRPISTITFISMQRPLTAPGNFIILLVRPLPYGGFLTACASNTSCRLSKNRASTARAAFFTMASGLGKSRPLPSSGCGWLFSPLWRKSPRTLRLSSSHGGVRLCRKTGRGGVISFLAPGQEKPTRLRASTLGAGFDPEDIKAVIAGERPLPELPEEPTVPPRRVNLIIDIQERMAQGKGPAYERWAKVYNLKQMAAALQYLQEHHLTDYAALTASTEAAVDHFHKLSDELRTTEEALSKTSELMAARWTMPRPARCSMVQGCAVQQKVSGPA